MFEVLHEHWEKQALLELYSEYQHCLRERNIKLRPPLITLTDSDSYWGKWDLSTRTLTLSRKLIKEHPWHHVVSVLKHEMAHQYVDEFESNKPDERPHGEQFQNACKKLGLPAFFHHASIHLQQASLDWQNSNVETESQKMLERVRKLLNLASSTNEHEALVAMQRVREIYARYNLEQSQNETLDFFHLIIPMHKKRMSVFHQTIVSILAEHFFVKPIITKTYDIHKNEHLRAVELIGKKENVLMAEYVYHFLLQQSVDITKQKAKQTPLSNAQKKSFQMGVLSGFREKLAPEKKNATSPLQPPEADVLSKSLEIFHKDKKLDSYISQIFPRLNSLSSKARLQDGSAYQEGKLAGKKLSLHKPVQSHSASGIIKQLFGR